MREMNNYRFALSAECQQFYIQDEWADDEYVEWNPKECDDLVALSRGTIGVGTACDRVVPLEIQVTNVRPILDVKSWDHLVECGIQIPSGQLVVAGCFDEREEACRIELEPGSYRALLCYGNQYPNADHFGCADHYKIILWPGESGTLQVLKRRTPDSQLRSA